MLFRSAVRPSYWIPSGSEFPGLDGYFDDGERNVYVLRASVASDRRSPRDGLEKLWRCVSQDARSRRAWHFVVVGGQRDAAMGAAKELESRLCLGSTQIPVVCSFAVLDV